MAIRTDRNFFHLDQRICPAPHRQVKAGPTPITFGSSGLSPRTDLKRSQEGTYSTNAATALVANRALTSSNPTSTPLRSNALSLSTSSTPRTETIPQASNPQKTSTLKKTCIVASMLITGLMATAVVCIGPRRLLIEFERMKPVVSRLFEDVAYKSTVLSTNSAEQEIDRLVKLSKMLKSHSDVTCAEALCTLYFAPGDPVHSQRYHDLFNQIHPDKNPNNANSTTASHFLTEITKGIEVTCTKREQRVTTEYRTDCDTRCRIEHCTGSFDPLERDCDYSDPDYEANVAVCLTDCIKNAASECVEWKQGTGCHGGQISRGFSDETIEECDAATRIYKTPVFPFSLFLNPKCAQTPPQARQEVSRPLQECVDLLNS